MRTIAKFDHGRNHQGSTIFKRSFADHNTMSKNRSTQVLSLDNNQSTPSQYRTLREDASAQECYGTVNMLSEGASSASESCHVMFLHEQTGQFQQSNSGSPSQVSQHQTVCSPTGSLRSISESIARNSPKQITNAHIDATKLFKMTHLTQNKAVNVRDKVVKTIAKLDRKAAKRIFHSRQSSGHMNSQPQLKQNSFPCIFIKNSQVPSASPFPKKGAVADK